MVFKFLAVSIAALKAVGWSVVKEGNSLYLDFKRGYSVIVR